VPLRGPTAAALELSDLSMHAVLRRGPAIVAVSRPGRLRADRRAASEIGCVRRRGGTRESGRRVRRPVPQPPSWSPVRRRSACGLQRRVVAGRGRRRVCGPSQRPSNGDRANHDQDNEAADRGPSPAWHPTSRWLRPTIDRSQAGDWALPVGFAVGRLWPLRAGASSTEALAGLILGE